MTREQDRVRRQGHYSGPKRGQGLAVGLAGRAATNGSGEEGVAGRAEGRTQTFDHIADGAGTVSGQVDHPDLEGAAADVISSTAKTSGHAA